ncbi:MAG: sigma-70 family RNA polymerase sigma factor, partial [Acidimicrobiia bacterium]|nr:sigma-70 family RNA polymerase sigma factor [Acidimicrobiia bacterium]
LAVAVRTTTSELTNELGRVPSPAELADRLGVTVDQIALALDAANAQRTNELETDPSSDETWDAVDTGLVVPELLDGLPEQERAVVSLRFYGGLSQSQIAERIGVSQMQVSRLLRRALTRLRTEIGDA